MSPLRLSRCGNSGLAGTVDSDRTQGPSGLDQLADESVGATRRNMATVTLTQENFEQTVSAGGIVLVDFWATWCGPCRQFGPVFEEASEKHPDVVFGKIDTDDQQQLAMAAQITSIPTLMAFRDGIAVFRQSGALPLSALEDLISQIQNLDMDDVRAKIAEADKAE